MKQSPRGIKLQKRLLTGWTNGRPSREMDKAYNRVLVKYKNCNVIEKHTENKILNEQSSALKWTGFWVKTILRF